jgi:C-terminal processing protease CtpA/Prc
MRLHASLLSAALFAGLTLANAAHATDAPTLAREAHDAYVAKDFARSADLYAAAANLDASDTSVLYNAACSAALAGRTDDAFRMLNRAVDGGWADPAHLGKDTDLASLHGDPRWLTLVAAVARTSAQREKLWNNPALTSAWDAPLTEDQRVAGLSRLWSEAKYNFANFDLVPDLDWDAAYLQALPRVRAPQSNEAYFKQLQAFTALLQDGHTNIFPGKEAADAWNARPGINTLWLEDHVIVRDVFDPALQATGLQRGWEIVAVEGQPVGAYATTKVVPYVAGSTPQDRASRTFERFLLSGRGDTPVHVTVRDLSGRTHAVTLPRMAAEQRQAVLPNQAPFEWTLLPGNIALVTLRSFGNSTAADEYIRQFDEIAKADAIVFDLRDNGGGSSNVGYRILSTLTDKPFLTSAWRTRDYRPAFRAWEQGESSYRGKPEEVAPDAAHHYARPVLVLTSARTYSAAEDFLVAFDTMQRGRIVGEPTGGSTGQPLVVALPGGMSVRICTKRDAYPDGREFVGVGIQPQVVVRPSVADYRARRDTVLDAATQLLRGTASAKASSATR